MMRVRFEKTDMAFEVISKEIQRRLEHIVREVMESEYTITLKQATALIFNDEEEQKAKKKIQESVKNAIEDFESDWGTLDVEWVRKRQPKLIRKTKKRKIKAPLTQTT